MEVFTNYDILSAVAQDMKPSTQKRKGKEDIIIFVPFLLLYKTFGSLESKLDDIAALSNQQWKWTISSLYS